MGSSRELGIGRSGKELGGISWHGKGLLWTFAVGAGAQLISCQLRTARSRLFLWAVGNETQPRGGAVLAGVRQEPRRGGAITLLVCTVASGLPAQADTAVCLGSWKPVCTRGREQGCAVPVPSPGQPRRAALRCVPGRPCWRPWSGPVGMNTAPTHLLFYCSLGGSAHPGLL